MVKSAYYRKAIKQLFPNYICPTHTDWLFFSYWVSSLILSSLLVMPLPLLLSPLIPSFSLHLCLSPPALHHAPTPLPSSSLLFPSLSNRCTLSSSPSLLMFWRWHTLQKPHDLWHCLLGQLLFPSLINFDVEPNEIRQLIKAAADSGLIYSRGWHPSKWQQLMRRSLVWKLRSEGSTKLFMCSSSAPAWNGLSMVSARRAETLHITAQLNKSRQVPLSPLAFCLTAPFPFSRL